MGDRRWGFEEAEDWEYDTRPGPQDPAAPSEETLVGQDLDHVVEVMVSPDANPLGVRLSPGWRQMVDPRGLHASVLAAANAATMTALARRVEQTDLATPSASPTESAADESALTGQDMARLLDAVDVELGRFTRQLSAVVDQRAEISSAGGHVHGSAQRGQVLALELDSIWAGRARPAEIEAELIEVLRGLHNASTPRELAGGPSGTAISELMGLAADPQRLLRRLGLPAGDESNGAK